jgi:hypothetical protein
MRGIFAGLEPEFTLRLFKRCALKVHPDKARGNDLEFSDSSRRTPFEEAYNPGGGPYVTWSASGAHARARPHSLWGSGDPTRQTSSAEWLQRLRPKGAAKRVAFKDFHKTLSK